jgi:hypothetical protein
VTKNNAPINAIADYFCTVRRQKSKIRLSGNARNTEDGQMSFVLGIKIKEVSKGSAIEEDCHYLFSVGCIAIYCFRCEAGLAR